jgi:hypothetical protein
LTPGILPSFAILRKQTRQILNFLYTALARPQIWQRVYPRLLYFGFFAALFSHALVAILYSNFLLLFSGSGLERHSKQPQQFPAFIVRFGAGYKGNIHTLLMFYLGRINFRKHALFVQTHRVVAHTVKTMRA